MNEPPIASDLTPILSVNIQSERDVVAARQRARQISALLGFSGQDQARVATAVSEIARNAYQYTGGGQLEYFLGLRSSPQYLWVRISDRGRGIADLDAILSGHYNSPTGMGLGIIGSRRLMDEFHISTTLEVGSTVHIGKSLPLHSPPVTMAGIGRIGDALIKQSTPAAEQELQSQNRDLLQTLTALRTRELELEKRQLDFERLNLELEETNLGVVALYRELEENATALRQANEMKNRFLSHVTHEFRTPVNSVLALTRILIDRTDGGLSPEQEKQITYIRVAAQQLADIVNDLLDLAKVESGKTEVLVAHFDLSQFMGSTRALMRPLVTREGVNLVFEESAAGFTLHTDESKLGQILRNLISNALKFTQHGEVHVSAHVNPANGELNIVVRDTGIGIAPQDLDRIFEEFMQVRNPLQSQVKGTGLGLPLSRRLAGLLGGTLRVESALGSGSTFTLTLPRGSLSQAELTSNGMDANRHSDAIFVVDDEPASQYLVQQLFRGSRYRVIEVIGSDAAERARFEHPALILLDLVMPGRSGFEVLDELKRDERICRIPVVIHTSKTLTPADTERLAGRHFCILPKGEAGRRPALLAIRKLLDDPILFSAAPEFSDGLEAKEETHV